MTALRLKFNGFTSSRPGQVYFTLNGPVSGTLYPIVWCGGEVAITNIDIVIDDASANRRLSYDPTPLLSGTYRPDAVNGTGSLEGLLLTAPVPPTAPTEPPAPTVIASPWPAGMRSPRILRQTVDVGQRILAPEGELGAGIDDPYRAGHINLAGARSNENLYAAGAYQDPSEKSVTR